MKKLLILLLMITSTAFAADTPVGLVLDLQGKASIKTATGQTPLSILSYLPDGSEINLDAGSKLTVTHYNQKNQQVFSGSAKLAVKTDAIKVLEGHAGKSTSLADVQVRLANKGLESKQRQAALVMRGFGGSIVMSPANRTAVKAITPEFSWTSFEGNPALKIVIFDDEGEEVFTAEVSGNTYQLPQEKALTKGKKYSWTVIKKEVSTGASAKKQQFMVLTDEQITLVENQKPDAQSTFADKVLYAGLLEELWLKDEAKALWKALFNERPDDENLKRMAEKG